MTALPRVGARVSVTGTKDDATFTMTDRIKSWLEAHDEMSFVFENGFAFNSKMWPGWEVSFAELEPPKPALPAEPANKSALLDATTTDVWVRDDGGSESTRRWYRTGDTNCYDWPGVLRITPDPVPLVPAPDLAELVAAYRGFLEDLHAGHPGSLETCDYEECVECRPLLIQYETGAAA